MLKIKMIAIVLFGAAISLFSKDLSTSNNQPTQAKVVIEYEDGKTILSAPDLEPKEQCTYQWQQSADGKTWKNIRGAKKPQAQAVKDLPVNTFVRLQIKDGKSILYSTGAQTKPIDIASPLGYVYKSCTVKLEAVFIDDVDEKFIKTDDNNGVAYQWYKKDESGVWKPILSNDGNGEGLVLATTEEGWYKFLSFSDGGYSDNYETEKKEGVDYISSVEYYLEQKGGDGGLGELHFDKQATSIKVNQIEYEIGNKDADPIEISVCAGDQVEMNVGIVDFSENVTYKWERQRANSNKWVDAGAQKKLSQTMNQGTMEFKCTVTPSVDLGCEREAVINFIVNVYDEPNNPQLKVITSEDYRGVKEIDGIYYVCADPCEKCDFLNEVKLVVQPNPTGGCTFKGVQDPANPVSEGQIPQPTYIYEMAVYKWEGTDWGTEPDEKYTKLLNNYDPGQGLSYDFETKGFHFNKRTFKYEFDKNDEEKIQEESIKVCIHVIDSCAWAANEALSTNKQDLYKIGVPTNEVIIAKYPTLKEQLEDIAKGAELKYYSIEEGSTETRENAHDLPIGDECGKTGKQRVFLQFKDAEKNKLKDLVGELIQGEEITFEWEQLDALKDAGKVILDAEATTNERYTSKLTLSKEDDADKIDELLENSLYFDVEDICLFNDPQQYGENVAKVNMKATTKLCKEECPIFEDDKEFRKVNQVQLRGLIDCNAVEGEKKVCPNNEKYQLSFDAKYGEKASEENPNPANYRIWVEHKAYTNVDDEDPAEEEFLQVGEHTCNGADVWWDGDQTKCVFELNLEKGDDGNLKYTKHKFTALVVTERCSTIIGNGTTESPEHYKATIDEQIKELNDNADLCGFSWDTTEFVIKVSESPTAPLIAILKDGYTANINQTEDGIEIKKGTTTVDASGFIDDVENVRYEENGTWQLPTEGITLKDGDDEIAWTIYALEKGQDMPKVSLLTLEGGDSLGCNCNEHTIDLTDDKQVKQSTYTYSWEKTTDVSDMSSFTEVEQRHYASWETYQKAGVVTSQRFTGIFKVPALADNEDEVFYRLKMTDCCGKVTYSNIIQITAAESEPVTPVIGWDITEDDKEKDKRGANYPYTDKENKKTTYYYNIETKTCANGAVDPIAVVNTKEFEENESPIDKFQYQWQRRRRSGERTTDGKLPTNWNPWEDITTNGTSQIYTPEDAEFVAGAAYQYRLVAWAPSHLKYVNNDPNAGEDVDAEGINKGKKVSEAVTVTVYKDVTKTKPSNDDPIEVFGTKNAKITDPLKLDGKDDDKYAMVLENPDKLPYTSYSWAVSPDGNDYVDLDDNNAEDYFVTSTSYNESTLQLSKFPSDAEPRYYQGTVTYECGTHSQVFIVQANSSEKTTPVIGYEICEPSNTTSCDDKGKEPYKFTKADGTELIMYYKDDDISICATEAATIPAIKLVNTSEFEDHELTTVDGFRYKWQKRSGDRKGQDLPADADWSAWTDIIGATDPAVTPIAQTDNFEAGAAYQYRLVAWADSHLEKDENDNLVLDPADQAINKGMEVSNIITVLVWNDIEKDVTSMQEEADKDENMTFDSNEGKTTLEGTIHEAFDQGKALTIIIDNPDKVKHPETYTWYVGKDEDGVDDVEDDEWKPLTTADASALPTLLKEYHIADGQTYNTNTLKITQMPDDATPLYYKVVAEACTTIEHIFEVKAVYSRTDFAPVIGIGDILNSTENPSDCKQGYQENFVYPMTGTSRIRYCYKTELENNLCDQNILGKVIQLANSQQFDDNTIMSDKYHFVWQKREGDRKSKEDDPDWEDVWTNITDPYDYNETQVDPTDNTKGKNTTQLDYTTNNSNAPHYKAGKAYQYRLVVYTDQMATDDEGNPLSLDDILSRNDIQYSNEVTIRVNKKLENKTDKKDKIGCKGAAEEHQFTIVFENVDDLTCEFKWEAGVKNNGEVAPTLETNEVKDFTNEQKIAYYIKEVQENTITISKMPDDPTKTYYYRVTVTSDCGDAISEEFTLKVMEPLAIINKEIKFKDSDGIPIDDDEICENGSVTVFASDIKVQNGNDPLTLGYYFLAKDRDESQPTDEERDEAATNDQLVELNDPYTIDERTDVSAEFSIPNDPQELSGFKEDGWIWLKITDDCGISVWSEPKQVKVNPAPTTKIECSYNYETDVICLNDPLKLSYTPDASATNITYTWSVINRSGVSYKFLKEDGTEATEAELSSLFTIKVKWTENNVTDQELVDATIKLTAKNTQTNCSSEDEFLVKICHEELLPQVTIGQKKNTEILLITEGIQGEQLYKWGYTSKADSKTTDTTDWIPYSYWRYDYPYTDYGWKEPHTIDNAKYNYWVIVKGASDEKSYCQRTSELGTTDVNPKEKKHRYYTVKTKTDVTSAQNIPVYIDNPELKSVHLRLISSFGVVVVQKQLPPQATIETSLPATFSSGLYLLHVQVGDEQTTVKIRIQ